MKRTIIMGVLAAGLFLAQALVAQELRPEAIAVNTATPRGALKVLRTAMERGDAEGIRSVLQAANETEKAMVEAMAQTAVSVKGLHDAAVTAFGRDKARALTGEGTAIGPDGLSDLDRARETISEDGMSATVSFDDVSIEPIELKRKGEQWYVPVGALKQLEPAAMAARMAEVKALNAVVDEITAEVAARKYATAEEAKAALYDRLVQMAQAATTQPATGSSATGSPATGQSPTTQPR